MEFIIRFINEIKYSTYWPIFLKLGYFYQKSTNHKFNCEIWRDSREFIFSLTFQRFFFVENKPVLFFCFLVIITFFQLSVGYVVFFPKNFRLFFRSIRACHPVLDCSKSTPLGTVNLIMDKTSISLFELIFAGHAVLILYLLYYKWCAAQLHFYFKSCLLSLKWSANEHLIADHTKNWKVNVLGQFFVRWHFVDFMQIES